MSNIEKSSVPSERQGRYSSVLFLNDLKATGMVVVPSAHTDMNWPAEFYSKVLGACKNFSADHKKNIVSKPVIWLDPEGIIVDFFCNKDIQEVEILESFKNCFDFMELDAKKIHFKNGDFCFRFVMNFKAKEV